MHISPSVTAALEIMIYMHVHSFVHVQRENDIAAAAKPVPPKTVTFTAGGTLARLAQSRARAAKQHRGTYLMPQVTSIL